MLMHFDSATNDPVADIIYKILCDHLGAAILTTETRRTWSYTEELRLFSANLRDLCASVVSFTTEPLSAQERHRAYFGWLRKASVTNETTPCEIFSV